MNSSMLGVAPLSFSPEKKDTLTIGIGGFYGNKRRIGNNNAGGGGDGSSPSAY